MCSSILSHFGCALKILFESQLIEYLKIEFNNPGIILFGSFAKGEDIEKSDIDLYLETPSKKQVKKYQIFI